MTALLNKTAFDLAQQFLKTQARPLEAARFRVHFEGAAPVEVLHELSPYQNADGGFGHGLEPDFRSPKSSILCTSIAFQVLREVGAPPDLESIQRAIAFCVSTLNEKHQTWPILPRDTDDSIPHAPWWNQADQADESPNGDDDEAFSLNPSAEMLGYFYAYSNLVPSTLMPPIAERVLQSLSDRDTIEMHDLLCCLRLLNAPNVPKPVGDRLQSLLADLIPNVVDTDPQAWSGYRLRPLQVIDRPDSPFMPGLEEAVAANLDFAIASQTDEGAWVPTWSWGDQFPEAWAIAQREWAGMLTLDRLLTLRRFNRIEPLRTSP
ncbi:MAG: hypothetical protein VKL39_06645 [Leptolyngbyaceae bacterium]|nr:hypothetical protein [Leptolyngbyaceae bacterium]